MREINKNIGFDNESTKKETPLILASLNGHWDLVKSLIDNGCGVIDFYDKKNGDVLTLILEDKMNLKEKAELVNKIILSGKYVNRDCRVEDCYEYTMEKIAGYGDAKLLQSLLRKLGGDRQLGKLLAEKMLRKAASSDHDTADMIEYLLSLKTPDGMQLCLTGETMEGTL